MKEDRAFGNGLYLVTGKQKFKHNADILYCGITKNEFIKRLTSHHKKDKVTRDFLQHGDVYSLYSPGSNESQRSFSGCEPLYLQVLPALLHCLRFNFPKPANKN